MAMLNCFFRRVATLLSSIGIWSSTVEGRGLALRQEVARLSIRPLSIQYTRPRRHPAQWPRTAGQRIRAQGPTDGSGSGVSSKHGFWRDFDVPLQGFFRAEAK